MIGVLVLDNECILTKRNPVDCHGAGRRRYEVLWPGRSLKCANKTHVRAKFLRSVQLDRGLTQIWQVGNPK